MVVVVVDEVSFDEVSFDEVLRPAMKKVLTLYRRGGHVSYLITICLNKLPFPLPLEVPYEIWFQSALGLCRRCLNLWMMDKALQPSGHIT